jgi:hypothetical protein
VWWGEAASYENKHALAKPILARNRFNWRQMMATKIPIFVSAPTALSPDQQKSYQTITRMLDRENLERRALGATDYPME